MVEKWLACLFRLDLALKSGLGARLSSDECPFPSIAEVPLSNRLGSEADRHRKVTACVWFDGQLPN